MSGLQDLAHQALDAARAAGADAADVLAVAGDSLSIEVLNGSLEHAERAEGTELGLRVIIGRKQAVISSSDLRDQAIRAMAERAVAMATVAPDDRFCGLAEPGQLATGWDVDALELADDARAEPPELQDVALAAEAAAAAVPGVSKVQSAGTHWSGTDIWLAATNGFSAGYRRTGWSTSAVAISGEGLAMERDYAAESRAHRADLPGPDDIGRLAGERAVGRAGSRKPPTGTFPVLFDERISSSLVGHLVAAINGSMIARGSSWLKDALGTSVLPDGIDLTEDPTRPRISGSRPFDGEGLPVARRCPVENGVLTGWTLDLATGRQLGLPSTGNAGRGTSAPPTPTTGNLALTQGASTRDDLIRDMGNGLLITSMIGSTINPTTGDYSRGAAGYWVENGAISYPVNECTVAGNLRAMLRRIVPANDARTHLSRVVPSILIDGLTIAGS